MPLSLRLSPPAAPAMFRALAILALAAGVGVWGAVLLAPKPPRPARRRVGARPARGRQHAGGAVVRPR